MRIPFDWLCLAAVVDELQPWVGGRLQKVVQTNANTVFLELYSHAGAATLLVSCDPEFARAHLVTRRPKAGDKPLSLQVALRSRSEGGTIKAIRQISEDRVLEIEFESDRGESFLVAELMGRNAIMVVMDGERRVLAASRWVKAGEGKRGIAGGKQYELPNLTPRVSPFLAKLVAADSKLEEHAEKHKWAPVLAPDGGAYPLPVSAVGLNAYSRPSLSVALEQHVAIEIPRRSLEAKRRQLITQLERVELSRDVALNDLLQASEQAAKARSLQVKGELILASGKFTTGKSEVILPDYEGEPITILLDPEKTPAENAKVYFDKAKKSISRAGQVKDQTHRITADLYAVRELKKRMELAQRLDEIEGLEHQARERKWLHKASTTPGAAKQVRPYEGRRIREFLGPGGYTVLMGENAEANDYLTLRVAAPSDLWLHVRGQTSAHVVIRAGGKPERVGKETIDFAAKLAVQNSAAKHSTYVPVDVTQRRYVRRPKGAAAGSTLYTHEKTIHIDAASV